MRPAPLLVILLLTACAILCDAESGYRLWLRYDLISDKKLVQEYQRQIQYLFLCDKSSATLRAANDEAWEGIRGLLGTTPWDVGAIQTGTLVLGTYQSPIIQSIGVNQTVTDPEGYIIQTVKYHGNTVTVITAPKDIGVLYGVFHFLRLVQTHQSIQALQIAESPKTKVRILNHWDNLDGSVERGYAGFSLWNWHKLPTVIDQRYIDYARANASIGINGSVLTNVNANALILTPAYLEKVAALADAFRPYGIRVYLTARFNAPMELDSLPTADPLNTEVQVWWRNKIKTIFERIPDFGGFVVKANSEGQPGPQNFNRTHADGANMLAEALQPYKGIVMWRAFVYNNETPVDRAMQAYNEFKPLDGKFLKNVIVQVKNGPIDFQPREPFHPLFGAMPNTPLMPEFQITQEYLGFSTHLVYLGTLFKECLDSDTYAKGKGSTVATAIDGTLFHQELTGMAGVANIGNDLNWCGHPFAQSNWYAFGRLAWNYQAKPEAIAEEWIRMTFSNDLSFIKPIQTVMMNSRENTVNYMTPLGLHHIMGWSHHHGPSPWIKDKHRADWTSVYYHKADSLGIGFNRTKTGTNAIQQYASEVQQLWGSPDQCPETLLLWFHHLPWNYRMRNGAALWDALCMRYSAGVDSVKKMQKTWQTLNGKIDNERFKLVAMLMQQQLDEAIIWRNACLLYWQTFSRQPIPKNIEKPTKTLDYYMKLEYPFAPGIRPLWR